MSTLTRRRLKDQHTEQWLIFCDDIQIGSIGMRSGVPTHVDQWRWTVCFYPPSHRNVRGGGTARTFAEARAAFEQAWRVIEPQITEADRLEHRRERAWTAWKQQMWKCGCKLPAQIAGGRSQCYCGAEIDSASVDRHIAAEHMT